MRLPSIPRTLRWASGTAALLIACFPTEPCACLPPLATLIVRGSVASDGAPVANAIVQAEGFITSSCASSRPVFVGDEHVARTNASGNYALRLAASISTAPRCLRIVLRPTSLAAADSMVVAGMRGTFKTDGLPDTLTLNFVVP